MWPAPAPSGEFGLSSRMRSSQWGWREGKKRERQVQVDRRARCPTKPAVASEEETALVTC